VDRTHENHESTILRGCVIDYRAGQQRKITHRRGRDHVIDSVPIQIQIFLSDKADNITSCGCKLSYDMFPGDDGDSNCARM
jgi:hypothetical protein